MKVIEILKLASNILEMLQGACVKMDDVRFAGIYDEYYSMRKRGEKSSYAVAKLSEKYGISERKVYYLLRKFGSDCNIGAAG